MILLEDGLVKMLDDLVGGWTCEDVRWSCWRMDLWRSEEVGIRTICQTSWMHWTELPESQE